MRRDLELAPTVLVTGPNPHALRAYVLQQQRRGALAVRSGMREVAPGQWGVMVVRHRRPRPAWVAPTAAVTVLGGAAVAGWFLVDWLMLLGALAVLAFVALLFRPRSGGGHGCETIVTVRHRHR